MFNQGPNYNRYHLSSNENLASKPGQISEIQALLGNQRNNSPSPKQLQSISPNRAVGDNLLLFG